jgi:hypothetical protein
MQAAFLNEGNWPLASGAKSQHSFVRRTPAIGSRGRIISDLRMASWNAESLSKCFTKVGKSFPFCATLESTFRSTFPRVARVSCRKTWRLSAKPGRWGRSVLNGSTRAAQDKGAVWLPGVAGRGFGFL